jgi:hypothetical protein
MPRKEPASERKRVTVDRPSPEDVTMALYAMRGIFRALCWIGTDNVDGIPDDEIECTRQDLVLAGEHIAVELLQRHNG